MGSGIPVIPVQGIKYQLYQEKTDQRRHSLVGCLLLQWDKGRVIRRNGGWREENFGADRLNKRLWL